VQARRLVKNSIIAVEAPDEEVDEDEWVEDPAEAEDIIARYRPDPGAGPSGSGDAAGPSSAPHLTCHHSKSATDEEIDCIISTAHLLQPYLQKHCARMGPLCVVQLRVFATGDARGGTRSDREAAPMDVDTGRTAGRRLDAGAARQGAQGVQSRLNR